MNQVGYELCKKDMLQPLYGSCYTIFIVAGRDAHIAANDMPDAADVDIAPYCLSIIACNSRTCAPVSDGRCASEAVRSITPLPFSARSKSRFKPSSQSAP